MIKVYNLPCLACGIVIVYAVGQQVANIFAQFNAQLAAAGLH